MTAEVILGDCLAEMAKLEAGSVSAIVTDPPYGLAERWSGGTWFTRGAYANGVTWDDAAPLEAVAALLSLNVPTIIWGGHLFPLPASRGWLVWVKSNAPPTMGAAELAWSNLDRPIRRFEKPCNGWRREHPTEKPVELMRWCLQQLPPGGLVLDPFAGSGTTGVACVLEGRAFLGIELDAGYADIARRRIAEAEVQGHLFGEVA